MDWLDQIKWDADGLVPVIAQEVGSNDVLMLAHMNREALARTAQSRRAVYWSRSRQRLWVKGEESGHTQQVHEIRLDCDGDVVLLKVTQLGHQPGIACHTGRHSCFFQRYEHPQAAQTPPPPEGVESSGKATLIQNPGGWRTVEPVLKDPATIYR
jgi:phosphoribosyl-AMP cyclohydrolase